MAHSIATLINFSTNEKAFLTPCINQAKLFSSQIIVCASDHFFDGNIENRKKLEECYSNHLEVQFIEFAFDPISNFYGKHPPCYWHNLGRMLGFSFLKETIDFILFLDVDEIVDGKRFLNWLENYPYQNLDALRLACYWYFRKPTLQAKVWEDTPLFIKKEQVHYDLLMHPLERAGTFLDCPGNKLRFVKDVNGHPMIHHYSWVRSKKQCLRKVRSWGHRLERNWQELVETEFARPFNGKDFVHGYDFIEVSPFIELKNLSCKNSIKSLDHVVYLSAKDIQKIDLELKFNLNIF